MLSACQLCTASFAREADAWTAPNTSCVVTTLAVRLTVSNAQFPEIQGLSINALIAKRNSVVLATL